MTSRLRRAVPTVLAAVVTVLALSIGTASAHAPVSPPDATDPR
jgi:hypothetical protein